MKKVSDIRQEIDSHYAKINKLYSSYPEYLGSFEPLKASCDFAYSASMEMDESLGFYDDARRRVLLSDLGDFCKRSLSIFHGMGLEFFSSFSIRSNFKHISDVSSFMENLNTRISSADISKNQLKNAELLLGLSFDEYLAKFLELKKIDKNKNKSLDRDVVRSLLDIRSILGSTSSLFKRELERGMGMCLA